MSAANSILTKYQNFIGLGRTSYTLCMGLYYGESKRSFMSIKMLVFGLCLIRYSLLPQRHSQSPKFTKMLLRLGLRSRRPDPTVRAYEAPPHSLVSWGGKPHIRPSIRHSSGAKVYFCTSIFLASVFIVFINNYLDSFLLEFCYYEIYLLSCTSRCTVMQSTYVKIQL